MTTNIERAAEVLQANRFETGVMPDIEYCRQDAQALADVGLLVTDEMLADVDDHLLPALLLDRRRLLASKEKA